MVIKDCDIKKIADSGQCFRIREFDGRYIVQSKDKIAYATQVGDNVELECTDKAYWNVYFDVSTDLRATGEYFKSCNSSSFVSESVNFCSGLRFLNQDPFETLVSFIFSQRKNIPSIRTSIEDLCVTYGTELLNGIYAFPTVDQLKGKNLKGIKGIGYRAPYVMWAVSAVSAGIVDFDAIRKMPYDMALVKLKDLYGVGDKIANCVLLYGLGFRNAFPLDVWTKRIVDEDFNGNFPYLDFKENLGVLQLWMYYYKRMKV